MLTRRRHDGGFTLVEMIVGLVVLAIALALSMPAVINTLQQGARASSGSAATSQAAGAMALLENDLRSIRAPVRAVGNDIDRLNVIDQLSVYRAPVAADYVAAGYVGPGPLYADPSPMGRVWAHHDILFAGPTMLEFWSDVVDAPLGAPDNQPELVRWYLINNPADAAATCRDAARWCVVRDVRYGDNQGRVLSEVITSGGGAYPRDASCGPGMAVQGMFCYRSRIATRGYTFRFWTTECHDEWYPSTIRDAGPPVSRQVSRGGVHRVNAIYAGRRFQAEHEAAGPYWQSRIHPLDRIVSVAVALPTAARIGSGDDVSLTTAQVEIRSRRSSEYQTAIMCGAR